MFLLQHSIHTVKNEENSSFTVKVPLILINLFEFIFMTEIHNKNLNKFCLKNILLHYIFLLVQQSYH